jgi:hypothetical protein
MSSKQIVSGYGAARQDNRNAPLYLLIAPWIVMLCIYHFGPFVYRPLSFDIWAYLGGALVLLVFGYRLGWAVAPHPQRATIDEPIFKGLVVASLAGVIGLLFDQAQTGLSLTAVLTDPMANRITQAEVLTSNLTTIAAPFGMITRTVVLIALLRLRRKPRDKWTYMAVLAVLGLVVQNLMQSGRESVLGIGVLLLGYWLVDYCRSGSGLFSQVRRLKLRTVLPVIAVVGVMLTYFFYIGGTRHYGVMTFERYVQEQSIDNETGIVKALVGSTSDEITIGLLSGLLYYSHQLSALDSIINAQLPVYGFGRNVLAWPLYELARIGIDLQEKSDSVRSALDATGEAATGFRTGLSFLIADFGNLGSLFFVLAMSVVLGVCFKRASSGRSEADQLAAVWMFEGFMFCIQSFPTDLPHCVNQFLMLCLLVVAHVTARRF